MEIKVIKNILEANDKASEENKKRFDESKVFVCNLMSSPGSGKTTLLEKTIPEIQNKYRVGIIEGDIYTSRDAERLRKFNVPIVQINTEGSCHLNANMIARAMNEIPLNDLDLVMIENVGNLVCPAEFNIGEDIKILVYSITEGDDKPAKYPLSFKNAASILINKMDLASHCDLNIDSLANEIKQFNDWAPLFLISSLKDEGLTPWIEWLSTKVADKLQCPELVRAQTASPAG